jgi:hypothetical protein
VLGEEKNRVDCDAECVSAPGAPAVHAEYGEDQYADLGTRCGSDAGYGRNNGISSISRLKPASVSCFAIGSFGPCTGEYISTMREPSS